MPRVGSSPLAVIVPTPTTTQPQPVVNAVSSSESPSPPTTAPSKPSSDSIEELLQKFELSQYVDVFLEHGYDSVLWLLEVSADDRIVKKIVADVGFKRGHAVRFQHKLVQEAEARRQIATDSSSRTDGCSKDDNDRSNENAEEGTSSTPPVIVSRVI